jgi:hypothetical protein
MAAQSAERESVPRQEQASKIIEGGCEYENAAFSAAFSWDAPQGVSIMRYPCFLSRRYALTLSAEFPTA